MIASLCALATKAQVTFGVTTPVEDNGDWVVEISVNNPNDLITSMQFDLTIGEDFSYTAGDYEFTSRAQKERNGKMVDTHDAVSGSVSKGGTIRMIVFSNDNEVIQGTSGTFIKLRLEGLSTAKVRKCNLTNIVVSTIKDGKVTYNGIYPQAIVGDDKLACYDVMDNDAFVIGELSSDAIAEMNLCFSTNSNLNKIDLSKCSNDNLGELSLVSEPRIFLAKKGQVSNKGKIYYKLGDDWGVESVVAHDGTTDFVSDMEVIAEKATYVRNFKNTSWQAWYTPFVVPVSSLSGELEFGKVVGVKEDSENVYFLCALVEDGELEANTPYLVKAATTGEKTMVWNDMRVRKMEEKSKSFSTGTSQFTFTGNYSVKDDMFANESYALSGGTLAGASSASVVLNPYRWFMDYSTISSVRKRCSILFDTMPNSIEDVSTDDDAMRVFDLNGRSTDHIGKGIYIIKGKKVMNK